VPVRPPSPVRMRTLEAEAREGGLDEGSESAESEKYEVQKDKAAETEDDEDDEDLDRPPKKIAKVVVTTVRRTTSSHSSSEPSNPKHSSTRPSSPPRKLSNHSTEATFDPDWLFNSLWNDLPTRPTKTIKTEKASLAAQLEESSLSAFGKKKAISLKDQFKFLES